MPAVTPQQPKIPLEDSVVIDAVRIAWGVVGGQVNVRRDGFGCDINHPSWDGARWIEFVYWGMPLYFHSPTGRFEFGIDVYGGDDGDFVDAHKACRALFTALKFDRLLVDDDYVRRVDDFSDLPVAALELPVRPNFTVRCGLEIKAETRPELLFAGALTFPAHWFRDSDLPRL